MKCKICNREAKQDHDGYNEIVNCKYCGTYKFAMSYEPDTYGDKSNFYKVSSYIREQNDLFNHMSLIDNDKFNEIVHMKDKKVKEKMDLLIIYLSTCSEIIALEEETLIKCWLKDDSELNKIFQYLIDKEFVKGSCHLSTGGYDFIFNSLTFKGIEYIEQLEEPNKDSKNIFIAFNFTEN